MKDNGYKAEDRNPYGYRSTFGKAYRKSPTQAYPSITDELRNDVQILKNSLEIKDSYIRDLKRIRDTLRSKLDLKELHIEDDERRIRKYREFFYNGKDREEKENSEIGSD